MSASIDALARFAAEHSPLLVITGAGLSTASGIPDYRGPDGEWKREPPVHLSPFVASEAVRCRYWARAVAGWPRFAAARPNAGHHALAALERARVVERVVTQNVDGLHREAGSRAVVELHGRLDRVRCLECRMREAREAFQRRLLDANPGWDPGTVTPAPDGDADIDPDRADRFAVPGCAHCGGVMKPDVVFFGENVPRARVRRVERLLGAVGGVLVAGTSLMAFSAYRFVRDAHSRGIPVALLNRGLTRADANAALRCDADCVEMLRALSSVLRASPASGTAPR